MRPTKLNASTGCINRITLQVSVTRRFIGFLQRRLTANQVPQVVDRCLHTRADVDHQSTTFGDKVTLDWPGFVAVYEDVYNKFDTLVGTSRFLEAGKHTYVPVDLVKEYKPGQLLYVVLHKDNGDAIYNLVQDPAVKDKRGFDISDSFLIRIGGFGHGK